MKQNKICVLLVDDETRMIRALRDFLVANKFNVITATDGEEALTKYYDNNSIIDVILLDVMLPKLDGYSVLKDIRQNRCFTPVIMLTARGEEHDQINGFENGADDYIVKPFSLTILLARIEALLKRVGKSMNNEVSVAGIAIAVSTREVIVDGKSIAVTKREFELLHFLLTNPRIIFSREQLLNSVWGYDFEGEERTVDTHIKQLRIKLGDKAGYIKTVHRVGYKFEAEF